MSNYIHWVDHVSQTLENGGRSAACARHRGGSIQRRRGRNSGVRRGRRRKVSIGGEVLRSALKNTTLINRKTRLACVNAMQDFAPGTLSFGASSFCCTWFVPAQYMLSVRAATVPLWRAAARRRISTNTSARRRNTRKRNARRSGGVIRSPQRMSPRCVV